MGDQTGATGVLVTEALSPAPIADPGPWDLVAVGETHSCGVKHTTGPDAWTLWCWGTNSKAELGDGGYDLSPTPVQVGGDTDWEAVGCGIKSTVGRRSGALYGWGDNTFGQLGIGEFGYQGDPLEVPPY